MNEEIEKCPKCGVPLRRCVDLTECDNRVLRAEVERLTRERDEARAQLADVAARQREACAEASFRAAVMDFEGRDNVVRRVRATPLVTGDAPRTVPVERDAEARRIETLLAVPLVDESFKEGVRRAAALVRRGPTGTAVDAMIKEVES